MTLAEVIALINSDIVPNGNNEITANVLRPILIEMLQQPNDLIGDLGNLNTDESDTLVDAINSVNNALSDVEGFVVLSGQGDPNQQTFPSLSIADLYSEIDGLGSPLALWIYDGTKFIRLSDKYLSYEIPQSLTPTEQLTARSNINATDRRLEELASDLTENEKAIIKSKLGITGGGGSGSTSLFDDIFIYNETENPEQEFELSFVPYQIVTVLDNNQMKWLDDDDYEVNGQTLKMLYPLENETKLRINYYHNL